MKTQSEKTKRPNALQLGDINIGTLPEGPVSAHVVYLNAQITNQNNRAVIYKENKHSGALGVDASLFEVAFSAIASLFIGKTHTPSAELVQNDQQEVTGIAVDNIANLIKETKQTDDCIFKLKNQSDLQTLETLASDNYQDAYEFTHTPAFSFKKLKKIHDTHTGTRIDMDSLARILTASYLLEEDDLHKKNMGFYVQQRSNDPTKNLIFFKIDHDLMFNQSIIAKEGVARPANIHLSESAFKITENDLTTFPLLTDSKNHYWPTAARWIPSFFGGNKAYNSEDASAYADLQSDPSFTQAKWKYFLKYMLIPNELITKSLTSHLDPIQDKAKIDLVANAVRARVSELTRVILRIKGFQTYLSTLNDSTKDALQAEIETPIDEKLDALKKSNKMPGGLRRELTLGAYDFNRPSACTLSDYRWAIDELNQRKTHSSISVSDFEYACAFLTLKPDTPDEQHNQTAREIKNTYLQTHEIKTAEQFIQSVDKIRQATLPLKIQKQETLSLLNAVQDQFEINELTALQDKLNTDPSLLFLQERRDRTGIGRKAHGLYDQNTRTYQAFATVLSDKITSHPAQKI